LIISEAPRVNQRVSRGFAGDRPGGRVSAMANKSGRLRIIGGLLKGRRLDTLPGEAIRPTGDLVREALFDILGNRVSGTAFLDAYAGTGAIGIEAFSRGAREVTFIEH